MTDFEHTLFSLMRRELGEEQYQLLLAKAKRLHGGEVKAKAAENDFKAAQNWRTDFHGVKR